MSTEERESSFGNMAESDMGPTRQTPPIRLTALLIAGALLAVGYVALLWSLDGLPFQDLPNHLARAVISADLLFHGGLRFGHAFAFKLELSPYVLGDLALASLVEVCGPYAGGRLWVILVAASLPVSVAVYLRVTGYCAYSVVVACVLSLYLATDWFFVSGFGSFRLAVACTLLAIAAWQSFLRSGSAWAYVAYVAMLITGYLTHLSTLLFCAVAAATIAVVALGARKAPLSRALCGGLPFVAMVAWNVLSSGPGPGAEALWLLPAAEKIVRLASPFVRYDLVTEGTLFCLFALACALMLPGWRNARGSGRVLTNGVLSLVFLGLYVAMPYAKGGIKYIDVRALPLMTLFALFCVLAIAEHQGKQSLPVAGLAIVLAAANVWVVRAHLRPANAEMLEYRALATTIPPGAVVLPIATRAVDGRTNPYLHAGTFATIETGAMTPYIFQGSVMSYFRPRARYSAPSEFWYQDGEDPGDTAMIARTYDFVLCMTPFDRSRLPVRTEEIARNDSAALLRVIH